MKLWFFAFLIMSAASANAQQTDNQPVGAELLANQLLQPYQDAAYWHTNLQKLWQQDTPVYPCHRQVWPVVQQFMLYHIYEKMNSDALRYQVANQLYHSLKPAEIVELYRHLQQKLKREDILLTYDQEKRERIKKTTITSNQIMHKTIKNAETEVASHTETKMPDILRAYVNPDGTCRNTQ